MTYLGDYKQIHEAVINNKTVVETRNLGNFGNSVIMEPLPLHGDLFCPMYITIKLPMTHKMKLRKCIEDYYKKNHR